MLKEKFLVITLSKREKKIVQLKARILGLTIDEYILKSMDEIRLKKVRVENTCPTCACKRNMLETTKSFDYLVNIGSKQKTIKVHHYPRFKCSSCEHETVDLETNILFEELMDIDIMEGLRMKELPEVIDFHELIKIESRIKK